VLKFNCSSRSPETAKQEPSKILEPSKPKRKATLAGVVRDKAALMLLMLLLVFASPLPIAAIAILSGRSVQQVLTLPGGVSSVLQIDSTDKNQKSVP
jgi:hypothetical protein